jgi:hypothetical protein
MQRVSRVVVPNPKDDRELVKRRQLNEGIIIAGTIAFIETKRQA